MFAGNLVEFGDIDEILLHPCHPYTWMLLDAISFSSVGSINIIKIIKQI